MDLDQDLPRLELGSADLDEVEIVVGPGLQVSINSFDQVVRNLGRTWES